MGHDAMLSAAEARQLDRLALGASRAGTTAAAAGLRHTRARGAGIEFQDYRHYQPGDDPRSIDWTVEARLQQLVVRVSRGDGHLTLHLLVDVSGSMAIGTPPKLRAAQKLAAALCYIAIERRDAVAMATFTSAIHARLSPSGGRPQMFRVLETLAAASAGGTSAIGRALTTYAAAVRGEGLVVVLSDFFEPEGALTGLEYLLYRGFTPAVVQVLATEERQPQVFDEVELVDIENPSAPPIVVDAASVAAYMANAARASAQLSGFCARHGLPWLQLDASASFEGHLHACVEAGLMRASG